MTNAPFSPNGIYEDSDDAASASDIIQLGTGFTQLIAATTFDYEGFMFYYKRDSTTSHISIDIAIGAAASEQEIVTDICIGTPSTAVAITKTGCIFIPVRVPKGSRISARCSSGSAVRVFLQGYNGAPGRMEGFSQVQALGVSSNRGVSVNAGAAANTKGAWAEITSSTADFIKALCVQIDENANTILTTGQFQIDIGIGAAGSEVIIIPDIPAAAHSTDDFIAPFHSQFYAIEIPPGTRIAARCQSSITDATDRVIGVSLLAAV